MALGRKTGGRQKGSRNRKTVETIEKVEQSGLMPLDYMLSVLRDEAASRDDRMEAAKNAAPYVHAKLASVEVSSDPDNPLRLIHEVRRTVVDPEYPNATGVRSAS